MIHDIVIAGAGPVGLFLACELRLAGRSVLVLESAENPRSPFKRSPLGLRGLSVATVEALHRRGLLEAVAGGAPAPGHWLQQPRRPAGHFAGIQFYHDRIDPGHWPYRLPGPADSAMAIDMEHLETVLADRAAALGVEVRRGVGVDGFDQSQDEVRVRAGDQTFSARWLVGCDGGRSVVRKAGGFAFAGTDPEITGYSLKVDLADSEKLRPGRQHTAQGMYVFTPPGTLALGEFDGGAFHRTRPITREHVQDVLRRVSGTDVTVKALNLASTWTDRAYQATAYRNGRVLLAGDAAHIHSPLGGQGLNLGLGDAMNLGWKLAATIGGDAPADLIDTYFTERYPVGERILDWSRAQIALIRPTRSTRALEAILRDLIDTEDGATYFADRAWGLSVRYDLGSDHPLVGRTAPDFAFDDGTTLGEHMRKGGGLLLDFDAGQPLQSLADRWGDLVGYLAATPGDRLGLSALVVRPDGIVAWASDTAADHKDAAGALRRWFGDPIEAGAVYAA